MILMLANALSISLCTRSTSDLRNVCSCRSSDESPSSPSIEFEVKRTMEDMILSASTSIWVSGFKILFSTKLPVSASPSDESDFSARAAEDDGGECLKPNDISNLVNNCLAERRPSSWRRSGPELKATGASSEKVSAISDGMRGRFTATTSPPRSGGAKRACVGLRRSGIRCPLTIRRQIDIPQSGPGWVGTECNSINQTARVHHAARRRRSLVAVRGAGATGGDAVVGFLSGACEEAKRGFDRLPWRRWVSIGVWVSARRVMLRSIQLAMWSQLRWMRTAPTPPNKSLNWYQRNGLAVMPLW